MKTINILLIAAAIGLCGCATSKPAPDLPPEDVIPIKMTASISGLLGAKYKVDFHDGVLTWTEVYTENENAAVVERVHPTLEQWQKFRKALDKSGVWKWQPSYDDDANITDGTHWRLDIVYADRSVHSAGANSYPTASGKTRMSPGFSKAFPNYLAAVSELCGGRDFK
jgi:hypothetical protein